IKRLNSDEGLIRLLDEQDASYSYVANEGDDFYFQTNMDAPHRKVIKINIQQPDRDQWEDVITEKSDVLQSTIYLNEKFITVYLHHAHHQMHIYNKDGSFAKKINLPVLGSLAGLSKNRDDHEIYFGLTSFVNPPTIHQYKLATDEQTI